RVVNSAPSQTKSAQEGTRPQIRPASVASVELVRPRQDPIDADARYPWGSSPPACFARSASRKPLLTKSDSHWSVLTAVVDDGVAGHLPRFAPGRACT